MRLTLGDLLAHTDLGLDLRAGGDEALDRPVAGAHAIEIATPSRWLPSDWVMLTAGLRLRGRADEQRRLVAELDAGGLTALGWGVELVQRDVPRTVLEEAERRSLPVFSVPLETPFREIITFINGSLLSDDLYVMRRVTSMNDYLLDALGADAPEPAIVERLSTMLDAEVALVALDGSPLRGVGHLGGAEVGAALPPVGDGPVEIVVGGRRMLAAPVDAEHGVAGWIVLAPRRGSVAERLARPVLRCAAQLLGFTAHAGHAGPAGGRSRRVELLVDALEADRDAEETVALDRRAAELGFDLGASVHAVAWARGAPLTAGELGDAEQAVEGTLRGCGRPFLLAPRDGWLAGIVQGPLDGIAERLLPEATGLHAGIGRAIASLGQAARSTEEARVALEHAGRDGRAAVARFDELDAASWLLASCDRDVAARKMAGVLDPLRAKPELLMTLRAYFDADLHVAEAALRLGLHPNTLRYRLTRIEELLGMHLEAPETIANLHLAMLNERLDGGDATARPRSPGAPAPPPP